MPHSFPVRLFVTAEGKKLHGNRYVGKGRKLLLKLLNFFELNAELLELWYRRSRL